MSNLNEKDIAMILNDTIKVIDYNLDFNSGCWKGLHDDGTSERDWRPVSINDVPLNYLFDGYETLLYYLKKDIKFLNTFKEEYTLREFEIVYQSDIDFKALYGSTSEKVRKQHASTVLKELKTKITELEQELEFIRYYIPFLREVIRTRGEQV